GKGIVELTVNPLPSSIIQTSLYSEGGDGVRVLTTRFRSRTIVQDNREDVKKLVDEVAQLNLAREKIDADIAAVQDNVKMLGKMEGFLGVTTIQATEKGALNTEAAIALAKYIREQRIETAREQINLKQQAKANQAKAEDIQKRIT